MDRRLLQLIFYTAKSKNVPKVPQLNDLNEELSRNTKSGKPATDAIDGRSGKHWYNRRSVHTAFSKPKAETGD